LDKHQGFEEQIRKLEEQIRETEIRQRLLVDAVARVAELVDPNFRSFSLLALISGFRGKEEK
jgi:predicted MarR family transcription regulator